PDRRTRRGGPASRRAESVAIEAAHRQSLLARSLEVEPRRQADGRSVYDRAVWPRANRSIRPIAGRAPARPHLGRSSVGITATIALMPGDGVGPEIVAEAVKSLDAVAGRFGHRFDTFEIQIGGAAIDAYGVPLRPEDLTRCQQADAVLLGAV